MQYQQPVYQQNNNFNNMPMNQQYSEQLQNQQIQTIQNQYNQNNAQKIKQQNDVKRQQIEALARQFQIDQAHPSDQLIGGPEREEMIVGIIQGKVLARLVIYDNFPETKPRFFMMNKFNHKYIDESTWEIIYITFYNWNEKTSQLVDLVNAIKLRFQEQMPERDPILHQMNATKNLLYEEGIYESILQCKIEELFPQYQRQQWGQLSQYQSLDQLLIQSPQYKQLVDYTVQLMEANDVYSQQMADKYKVILKKREEVQQLAQYCDIKKAELLKQFQNCQMIKERFDKTKVLNQLEQEIREMERLQEQMEQDNLESNGQQLSEDQFNQKMQDYLQCRRKYHEYKLKKEKLEKIL